MCLYVAGHLGSSYVADVILHVLSTKNFSNPSKDCIARSVLVQSEKQEDQNFKRQSSA